MGASALTVALWQPHYWSLLSWDSGIFCSLRRAVCSSQESKRKKQKTGLGEGWSSLGVSSTWLLLSDLVPSSPLEDTVQVRWGSRHDSALPSSFSDEQGAPAWSQPQTLIWGPKVEGRGSSRRHRTPGTSLVWKAVGEHQEFPISPPSGAYQVAQWERIPLPVVSRDSSLIPGLGRCPGVGNSSPLQ